MNNLVCKGFFSAVNSGLEALNFTDYLQHVLFYTKVFASCKLDFLLYDITQLPQLCQLAGQFSSNRVDDYSF